MMTYSEHNAALPSSFETFYNTLVNGNDHDIGSLIYRREVLTDGESQCCVNGVRYHFRSPNETGKLIEKSRQASSSGEFCLLIVVPSWVADEEDNYVPLIVTMDKENVAIAGIVLPFDELMTRLSADVCSQIGELSAAWVMRKIKADTTG